MNSGVMAMRTQVGIVGAGPAGLMLSHLLHRSGIHSIVLEDRSRDYVEQRVRAGVLEQWAADLLVETGVGERLQREAMIHNGINLCFDGALHHLNFRELVG
jgi:p-hydroxybenzoate 3-monooxygenase